MRLGKMVVGSLEGQGQECLYKSGKGHRTEPLRVPVRGRAPGGNGGSERRRPSRSPRN